jgi:hypothetical protein
MKKGKRYVNKFFFCDVIVNCFLKNSDVYYCARPFESVTGARSSGIHQSSTDIGIVHCATCSTRGFEDHAYVHMPAHAHSDHHNHFCL